MKKTLETLDELDLLISEGKSITRKMIRDNLKIRAVSDMRFVNKEELECVIEFLRENGYGAFSYCLTDKYLESLKDKISYTEAREKHRDGILDKEEFAYITLPAIICTAVFNFFLAPWYKFDELLPDITEAFYTTIQGSYENTNLSSALRANIAEKYCDVIEEYILSHDSCVEIGFDENEVGLSDVESQILLKEQHAAIEAVLEDELDEKERLLLDARFDLSASVGRSMTFNEIALLGFLFNKNDRKVLSRERVRQMERKALRRLRHLNNRNDENVLYSYWCKSEEGSGEYYYGCRELSGKVSYHVC